VDRAPNHNLSLLQEELYFILPEPFIALSPLIPLPTLLSANNPLPPQPYDGRS